MPSRAFISDCKIAQALRRSLSGGPQPLDHQRQGFTGRRAEDYITEAGQRCLVRVDFNEEAAGRLNVNGKLCGRVHDGARPDEEHAVAHSALVDTLVERVSRNRFAEHHGVALNDPAGTVGAPRRKFVDRKAFEGPAMIAEYAPELRTVAVNLGD